MSTFSFRTFSSSLLGLLLLLAMSGLAQAQATRTWVSGVGDDANPCSRTAPCKTFAGAISKTAARGVINVLDPGGFGAVTITKSITIEADGDIAGILVSGTNGVIINAAANDDVVLRGLTFNGVGTGLDGIRVLSARSVLVDRCKVDSFTGFAVNVQPTAARVNLLVRDSVFSTNGVAGSGGGVQLSTAEPGSASFTIDRTSFLNNTYGVLARGRANGVIRQSTVVGSALDGVQVDGTIGLVNALITDSTISDGLGNGVNALQVRGRIVLNNNVIKSNNVGIAFSGGQVISYGDNEVTLNTADGAPSATTVPK